MSTLGVISGTTTDVCLFMAGPSGAASLLLSFLFRLSGGRRVVQTKRPPEGGLCHRGASSLHLVVRFLHFCRLGLSHFFLTHFVFRHVAF
jgi:hypothetical protein